MFITFDDRPSDSPFIERVWRSRSDRADTFLSIAASHFEMVVTRLRGQTCLTLRGPETKATTADCPAEGEWLGIRFKLGTFMPQLTPGHLPGGAIAAHVRVGSPFLTHILFPIYVALMMWGGLYLRETRLRALLPLRR
jgi:hypothetical protein